MKPRPVFRLKLAEAIEGTLTREVTATGTLEPINQIEVGTQVSGVIEKIYVDFNAVVKKTSCWPCWIKACWRHRWLKPGPDWNRQKTT